MPAVALVFNGPISYPASKNLRNALCSFGGGRQQANFANVVFTDLYLLMSSEGGSVEDGIALFNLLRVLPVKLITVNMGQIASAANVPFLAAQSRWTCAHSYFHFHNFRWFYDKPQTVERAQLSDHSQIIDMERSLNKEIFVANTGITEEIFDELKMLDQPLIIGASLAKDKGIVQEIGMPTLPVGTPILNVDY